MTEKLYLDHPAQTEVSARVVSATEAGARANMVAFDVHQATIGVDPLPVAPSA